MKKGFTLIELLAVIVILAIIAVIAIPIVITIIDDSTDSISLISGEFYLDAVENAIMKKNMDTGKSFYPDECLVKKDGNLSCSEEIVEVKVDGERPIGGRVEFKNGEIEDVTLNYSDGITISLDFNRKLIFGEDTLANYIKNLYKETKTTTLNDIQYGLDETHLLMNDRLGDNKVDKLDGNIRYYGSNPNNYIDIGDRDSDGNIIFWRIIGVFKDIDVTDESGNVIKTKDLVKIVREDKLTAGNTSGFVYDYTSTGSYDNNWHDSTLQLMLNDEVNGYYGSGTTNYYNNSTTPIQLNFESTGLSSDAYSKVERVNWAVNVSSMSQAYADSMYRIERIGTNFWPGKIAMMYPSDYGYSADLSICQSFLYNYNETACKENNWLYNSTENQWTLLPYSNHTQATFNVLSSGVGGYSNVNLSRNVHPAMYLKSEVTIKEIKQTSNGLKYYVVK